ncbi:hypothetical protein U9M48_028121 [Paspalum notatum var. saurae]|uniref:Uncharacterized protein n=1 Tax=Paspalum notatum var. saurae TaxID=547442 RepID=A0AAQ3TXQ3_PASNO
MPPAMASPPPSKQPDAVAAEAGAISKVLIVMAMEAEAMPLVHNFKLDEAPTHESMHSVGKSAAVPLRALAQADFDPAEKFWTQFSLEGSKVTPPRSSADFRWKDYCPMVFRIIEYVHIKENTHDILDPRKRSVSEGGMVLAASVDVWTIRPAVVACGSSKWKSIVAAAVAMGCCGHGMTTLGQRG